MTLKEQLQYIEKKDYIIPDDMELDIMIEAMLKEIGSLDSELRDDLIYSTFFKWITQNKVPQPLLKKTIMTALDHNHLFYKITDGESDAVFTRTFSILLVTLGIYAHNENQIFDEEELQYIYHKVMEYSNEESDYRGHMDVTGWAHSTAHTADALDELASCKNIKNTQLTAILESIRNKVLVSTYTYIHKEDERLVNAVMSILERNEVSVSYFIEWIESFQHVTKPDNYMEKFALQVNVKCFLRSLYFRILNDDHNKEFLTPINEVLNEYR